jgi:hypothetical protein
MTAWAILGLALLHAMELPTGPTPDPVPLPHFPDRLHAFVWFNWPLVPVERMAKVVDAEPDQITGLAKSMGLPEQTPISDAVKQRAFITVIRRNWHLLPYEQLLELLEWTPDQLAYTLREDDFLYIKLGSLKPKCEALHYAAPDAAVTARAAAIALTMREEFPDGLEKAKDPLFGFIDRLSAPLPPSEEKPAANMFSPRFCSSYFAMYGDPLLDGAAESYPDGYLAQLSHTGVDGVWMQAVLYKLAEFPWDPSMSDRRGERLKNLARLVERAKKQGIGIYLYLNEPRAMPLSFFEKHPELKGVEENGFATMCTSVPGVRAYLRDGVASISKAVPDLAGFFTISASENLTNCWSHSGGSKCPNCAGRGGAAVIADLHAAIQEGIDAGGGKARLIAWDWGWQDGWPKPIADALPKSVAYMSVSEWSIPVTRGGIDSVVGEYSISTPGPGPRATRNWAVAKEAGLKTLAKVQANVTWELASVPYIPAVGLAAQHAANLRGAGIDGMMLGWTLGGCPSPNLEVFAEMGRDTATGVDDALAIVARRRFGNDLAPVAVDAWKTCSTAFAEYPYNIGTVYSGPQQMGPANPLWGAPTGYAATMVGFPYDGLDAWRTVYPAEVFVGQFTKMADGFDAAVTAMRAAVKDRSAEDPNTKAFLEETGIVEACAIHFRSVANQSAFVAIRNDMKKQEAPEARAAKLGKIRNILLGELALARRLYALQSADSRIGYEASNHYFYVPIDLAAKVINVRYLLDTWLPSLLGAPASPPAEEKKGDVKQ